MYFNDHEDEGCYFVDDSEVSSGTIVQEKPGLQALLGAERLVQQTVAAVDKSRATCRESCFLAAFSLDGEIQINKPHIGLRHTIRHHLPALGDKKYIHPVGKGFWMPADFFPYFIFHTHSTSPRKLPKGLVEFSTHHLPSFADLDLLREIARENYLLLASEEKDGRHLDWWINPVGIVVSDSEEVCTYQFEPEKIRELEDCQVFADKTGEACLELGKRWSVKRILEDSDIDLDPGSLLLAIINGQLCYTFPEFIDGREEELYEMIGLRTVFFQWGGDWSPIIEKFDLFPEYPYPY